jgi:hypothetical protein
VRIITLLTKPFSGKQFEKNEIGGVCNTYGERRGHTGFWWGNLRKGDHLEDPGVYGRIIIRRILRKCNGFLD